MEYIILHDFCCFYGKCITMFSRHVEGQKAKENLTDVLFFFFALFFDFSAEAFTLVLFQPTPILLHATY
ncbi:hypothetical protein CsSME_00021129 [Camellia sinensis var. sinensis]